MAYTDSKRTADRAASVAGVIAVHAALGYALIIGLQFTGVIPRDPPNPKGIFVDPLPLPPPPPPKPETDPNKPVDSVIFTPPTTLTLVPNPADLDTSEVLPPPSEFTVPAPEPAFTPAPGPAPSPAPRFDPVAAKARNDPGGWITQSDYKTSWINREWAGRASFRLQISASGKVEGCQITRSTGYDALDEATCALVSRRAKFEPARDSNGEKTAGTFTNSVLWEIPAD